MFNKNLKSLRKQMGISQENLAAQLNVVRQTVSKWENGLSVPDAEQLIKISEILGVEVSDLLGTVKEKENNPDQIAVSLAQINEQLAIKNNRARRIWRIVLVSLLVIVVLWLILLFFNYLPA